jgi:hypothetical protein
MPYKCPIKRRESAKERQKKYREKNKEKLKIISLGRYHSIYKKDEDYVEYRNKYLIDWKLKNKNYKNEYMAKNPDQREKARKYALEWQKKNPGKVRARNALRKKSVKNATPSWVNKEKIVEYYDKACEMQRIEGIKYHVDHIVPLRGKKVCGLHVPWNLQIIKAKDNLVKGNKFPLTTP